MTREVLLIEDDTELRESTAIVINQQDHFRCAVNCDWPTWHSRKPRTNRIEVVIASICNLDRPTHNRLRELRRRIPAAEVIVFCERATLSCLRELLVLGISSVVLKGSTAYDLSLALQATGHGGAYFSPGLSRLLAQAVGRRVASGGRDHNLTVREREVWESLAHGRSNKEIASRLKISPQTVETHVRNLYRKLACRNRRQARELYWTQAELSDHGLPEKYPATTLVAGGSECENGG